MIHFLLTLPLLLIGPLLEMFGFGVSGASTYIVFDADGFSEADESEFSYLDPNTEGVY